MRLSTCFNKLLQHKLERTCLSGNPPVSSSRKRIPGNNLWIQRSKPHPIKSSTLILTLRNRYLLKCGSSGIGSEHICADINCPSTSIDDDYALSLQQKASMRPIFSNPDDQVQTFVVCDKTPFSITKCKLASPSVTKVILECPDGLSETSPAFTAAFRIWLCSFPSHPFGWDNTKWMSSLASVQRSSPLRWLPLIYDAEHSSK